MNDKFREIIQRALKGEEEAYEELYTMTCRDAYFIALSITKNEDDANDILQDSYIKAFSSLDRVGIPEKFDGWVCRIVSNESKNYLKKKRPALFGDLIGELVEGFDEEETNSELIPHEAADNAEKNRLIMQIINGLPEDQRLIVLMYYYQNMKTAEIAEALNIPLTTVKYKLLAARKEIREKLEELEQDGTKLYAVPLLILPDVLKNASEQIVTPSFQPAILKNIGFSAKPTVNNMTGVSEMANGTGLLATTAGKVMIGVVAVAAVGGIAAAVISGTSGGNANQSSNVIPQAESTIQSSEEVSQDSILLSSEPEESVVTDSEGNDITQQIKAIDGDPNTAKVKLTNTFRGFCYENVGIPDDKVDEKGYMIDSDLYTVEYTRTISKNGTKRVITCSDIKFDDFYNCILLTKDESFMKENSQRPSKPTLMLDFMDDPKTEIPQAFTKLFQDITIRSNGSEYDVLYKDEMILEGSYGLSGSVLDAVVKNAEKVYSDDEYMMNFINCSLSEKLVLQTHILTYMFKNYVGGDFSDLGNFSKEFESGDGEVKKLSDTEAEYVEQLEYENREIDIKKENDKQYLITLLPGKKSSSGNTEEKITFEIEYTT